MIASSSTIAASVRRWPLRGSTRIPPAVADYSPTAWWLWPHVLSLDAPLVAVVWQWGWASAAHVRLPWPAPCVLGLGVWLIYLTDRLVDAIRAVPGDPVSLRHTFHSRWRRPLSVLAVAVAGVLAILSPCLLTRAEFRHGLILLAVALAYFWLVHGGGSREWTRHLPKEAAVGAMFAVGTAFFPWSQAGVGSPWTVLAVTLFGGLCFCNCALITVWEAHAQDVRNPASLLNAYPRLTARLRPCCFALAAASAGGWRLSGSAIFLPLAASALLLGLLDQQSKRFTLNVLRVLADAALLSPLLLI